MGRTKQEFQLGILPEPEFNWRSFLASYGFVGFLALLLAFIGIILPDTLKVLPNYHVTELIPRPSLRPESGSVASQQTIAGARETAAGGTDFAGSTEACGATRDARSQADARAGG